MDGKDAGVPLVQPPKRPASPAARRAAAAVMGLVALALCIAHYLWTEKVNRGLAAEIVQLKRPVEELNGVKKELETVEKKRAELQAECDKLAADLAQCRQVRSSLRQRVATLLNVLVSHSSDQMIIRKIAATGSGVVVHGTCLDPNCADALFGGLARALEPLGWRVQLPHKQAQELLVGGGPWQFELHIEEVAVPLVVPPAGGGRPAEAGTTNAGLGEPGPRGRVWPRRDSSLGETRLREGIVAGGEPMKLSPRERLLVLLLPLTVVLGGYAWWFNVFQRPKMAEFQKDHSAAAANAVSPVTLMEQRAALVKPNADSKPWKNGESRCGRKRVSCRGRGRIRTRRIGRKRN